MIFTYIIRQMWKAKKKPKKVKPFTRPKFKPTQSLAPRTVPKPKFKNVPIKSIRVNKPIPIVQTQMISDGGFFQNIIGATAPGAKKMQFPYELPVIETMVDITPSVKTALLGTAAIVGGGMVASAFIRRKTA